MRKVRLEIDPPKDLGSDLLAGVASYFVSEFLGGAGGFCEELGAGT